MKLLIIDFSFVKTRHKNVIGFSLSATFWGSYNCLVAHTLGITIHGK